MSGLLTRLPPEGVTATHVPTGTTGKVGKYDTRHPSGRPHVRLDHAGEFAWFPAVECLWEAPCRHPVNGLGIMAGILVLSP